MTVKIAQIIGARPQFIKYSAVSKAIRQHNRDDEKKIDDILINTGQHYDFEMSGMFFKELGIKEPDYNLEVGSGTHAYQTGTIMQRVEDILIREEPDIVIIYGDTNSTIGGALAAAKLTIPVFHVEAGLRSYNKEMPEEINRVLADHLCTVLLCPSASAVETLRTEGFTQSCHDGKLIPVDLDTFVVSPTASNPLVINVGDVMFDVMKHSLEIAKKNSNVLADLEIGDDEYFVLTIHRAESTKSPEKLTALLEFVNEISSSKSVIFPVHPRTRALIDSMDINLAENVKQIAPIGYFDMLMLMEKSKLIMTDSGGMQKEAYWLRTPCITMREETEWRETIESGWNVLYKDYNEPHSTNNDGHFYGDGRAAERIVNVINGIAG